MTNAPIVVWYRQDLRIRDQGRLPPLRTLAAPWCRFYVLDDVSPGAWALGDASRWWLHGSLTALGADLQQLGSPLVLVSFVSTATIHGRSSTMRMLAKARLPDLRSYRANKRSRPT
jgi:deoxyribodipyrimidine photolyase